MKNTREKGNVRFKEKVSLRGKFETKRNEI
jgi:hypothetical protein